MPKGGFGNLIALPLQKKPREAGHSVFVDDDLSVFPDQWAFLASFDSMSPQDIEPAILRATGPMHPLDVTFIDEEDLATPWKRSVASRATVPEPLPERLTITVANLVYFEKSQLTQPLTNRLIRLAAFQNPEFYRAQAMRISVWDKPRVIGCAENFPHHIGLPRGCLDAAKDLLRINGIRCDIQNERIDGTPIDITFVGTLRPDQEDAVAAMLSHDVGVLHAPTAFGKTVTGAAIIARRRVNTLILVHRTELLRQWQERLNTFLGIGKEVVGTIGDGKRKPTGKIDIAVMQSLSRKGEVDPIVEDYGQVIVDECHHVGAVSFDAILKRVKAHYVLGLTATPIRRDGQQPIIFMQCGPIRHTAAPPASAPHDLEVVPRTLCKPTQLPEDVGIQDIFRSLAEDPDRTAAIADEAQSRISDGRNRRRSAKQNLGRPQGARIDRTHRPPEQHPERPRTTGIESLRAAWPDVEKAACETHLRTRCASTGYTANPPRDREARRGRFRPSPARHPYSSHAGIMERHAAAVRRSAASGTRR